MKMFLTFLLVLCTFLPFCCGTANADYTYEDYLYRFNDVGTVYITDYSGEDETLEISETMGGKAVTAIGDLKFAYRHLLGVKDGS